MVPSVSRTAKGWLKQSIGAHGVQLARGLGRLRWGKKLRAVRDSGCRFRDRPLMLVRYVVLDPEYDNFTYQLENAAELAATLAGLVDRSPTELEGFFAEAVSDPALTSRLARRLWWRPDVKHPPPLGRRYSWYMLTRALRPELVVEAGVQDGLGSLALLRALERNAQEGSPGALLSIDTLETAGWMVDDQHRARWDMVYGSADEVLARALAHKPPVGLFIEDTCAPEAIVRSALDSVVRASSDGAILVAGSRSAELQRFCEERSIAFVEHRDRAHDHFFQNALTTFAGPLPAQQTI